MTSNDAAKVMPRGDTKVCDTIEIKIRTLDSRDHVLRVKEWVPIPVLKKKIASVTGVPPEDQHLIFDGRIFEDDQRLSTYHVEDGHTLHLLVRQSHQSAAASTNQMESNAYGHPGTCSASGSGQTRGSPVAYNSALESGQNRSSQGAHASNQLSQANISSERSRQVNNDTTRGTRSQDAARVFDVVPQLVEFHRRFVREDLNDSICFQQRLSPPEAREPQRTMLSRRTQAGSGTIRATEPNNAARGSNVLPQQEVLTRQTNNVRQIERRDLNFSHRQLGQPAAQSSKCTKNPSNKAGDRRSHANDDATGVMQSHDTTSVGSGGAFSSNAPHPLMPLTSRDREGQVSSATPNYSIVQIQRELLNDSNSSQHQRDPFKAPSKKRTKRNNE